MEELTLQAPLLLPEQGAVALRVSVAGPDDQGRREIAIHSRAEDGGGEPGEDREWAQNAAGALAAEAPAALEPLGQWPPEGAEPLDVDALYQRLDDLGFEYGPAFQGLSAAWRKDEQIYVEASLPDEQAEQAEHFALHPALLDATMHGVGFSIAADSTELQLPFSWGDVSIQGAGAGELRARLAPCAEGVSLLLADGDGAPVASIGTLAMRSVDPAQLRAAQQGREGLLAVEWREVSPGDPVAFEEVRGPADLAPEPGVEPPEVALWRLQPGAARDDDAAAAAGAAEAALELVQGWLKAEHLAGTRLVLLSEGAVASERGRSPDLAAAALWGLLRSAQSEHPGRFALVDSDGSDASLKALPAALGVEDEPQLALREGVALAPRVTRLAAPSAGTGEDGSLAFDPERTTS